MIPKSELIEMFEAIAEQTDWDMSGEMLWGYFFTDDDRDKLEACSDRLTEMGYEFVEITDGDEPDDPLTLQVEKIEIHSPDTLFQRNLELSQFAEEMGISSYDGMDVGSLDGDDDDFDDDDDDDEEDE
ncbi:MAG: ribonuclease E inhibitor RraB [Schlesneria sp.]